MDTHEDEDEIRQRINAWLPTTCNADLLALLPTIPQDVVFLLPGHPAMLRSEFHDFVRAEAAAGVQLRLEAPPCLHEIKLLGDRAFAWTRLRLERRPSLAAPSALAGHTLSMFLRRDGHWVEARDDTPTAPGPLS